MSLMEKTEFHFRVLPNDSFARTQHFLNFCILPKNFDSSLYVKAYCCESFCHSPRDFSVDMHKIPTDFILSLILTIDINAMVPHSRSRTELGRAQFSVVLFIYVRFLFHVKTNITSREFFVLAKCFWCWHYLLLQISFQKCCPFHISTRFFDETSEENFPHNGCKNLVMLALSSVTLLCSRFQKKTPGPEFNYTQTVHWWSTFCLAQWLRGYW